jgi:hypothetical protein
MPTLPCQLGRSPLSHKHRCTDRLVRRSGQRKLAGAANGSAIDLEARVDSWRPHWLSSTVLLLLHEQQGTLVLLLLLQEE